MHDTVM